MMRFLIGAAMVWAVPAQAQSITLIPGQTVSVTIDRDGVQFGDKGDAELTPYDFDALEQLRGATKAGQLGYQTLKGSQETPPTITDDTIHLRFFANGEESTLIVDNGYTKGMVYRARITVRGGTGPTDVCLVRPGKLSYEYWPDPIEKIELTAFALKDWKPGDPVPCV